MNILPAWKQGFTGKGVVVTILDDGIERDHPDLRSNYVRNSVDCINQIVILNMCIKCHRWLFLNFIVFNVMSVMS